MQSASPMTITMGQLVSTMFEAYERRYHDGQLAAVATQVTLADLLRDARRPETRPRRAK